MDSKPASEITSKVLQKLQPSSMLLSQHLNLFTTAQICHTAIYSKIAYLLDAPFQYEAVQKSVRTFSSNFFRDGQGRRYTWALITLPKKKGGLGLIDPIVMAETRLMAQFRNIVTGRNPELANMVTNLFQDNLKSRLEVSLTAIITSPSVATINKVKDYKSFSGRLFSMLLTFRLDLIMEPKWEELSPEQVMAMPFYHPIYSFYVTFHSKTMIMRARILAEVGLASYIDVLWKANSGPGRGAEGPIATRGLRPPSLTDVRDYMENTDIVNKWLQAERSKETLHEAFGWLKRHFSSLVQLWPPSLMAKILEFVDTHVTGGSSLSRP